MLESCLINKFNLASDIFKYLELLDFLTRISPYIVSTTTAPRRKLANDKAQYCNNEYINHHHHLTQHYNNFMKTRNYFFYDSVYKLITYLRMIQ